MTVYSMTGYASAQASLQGRRFGLEIRSVNGRFLDISLRLPETLRALESDLRKPLTLALKRGKVELRLSVETEQNHALGNLEHLLALEAQVLQKFPAAARLSVADILRSAQGYVNTDGGANSQAPDPALLAALLQQVLQQLLQVRASEGTRLVALLQERINGLRVFIAQARPLIPELVNAQRERFLQRWDEALRVVANAGSGLDGQTQSAQERALSEASSFALRIDVAEELERLSAHLDEMETLLQQGGPLGKRLDFLLQELHREANTLGSKSTALELSRISMEMKILIEQMREQVQNIE